MVLVEVLRLDTDRVTTRTAGAESTPAVRTQDERVIWRRKVSCWRWRGITIVHTGGEGKVPPLSGPHVDVVHAPVRRTVDARQPPRREHQVCTLNSLRDSLELKGIVEGIAHITLRRRIQLRGRKSDERRKHCDVLHGEERG